MRRLVYTLLLLLSAAVHSTTRAQQPLQAPTPVFNAQGLGDQLTLDHGWLFHPGDNPAWSSPTLDDHAWLPIDLHKGLNSYGFSEERYGWLRLHLRLPPGAGAPYSLGFFRSNGRYQVFANGTLIGAEGNISRHDLYERDFLTQFPLPASSSPAAGQDLVLALRFSLQTVSYTNTGPESPFNQGTILLGTSRSLEQADAASSLFDFAPRALDAIPAFLTGLVALAVFFTLRTQREYLWLALYAFMDSLQGIYYLVSYTGIYNLPTAAVGIALNIVSIVILIEFIREILHRQRSFLFLSLEGEVAVLYGLGIFWAAGLAPYTLTSVGDFSAAVVYAVLLFLLLGSARARNLDARFLALGVLPLFLSSSFEVFRVVCVALHGPHFSSTVRLGHFHFDSFTLSDLFFELVLLLFLVTRTVRIARERNRVASELEAAREVQHVLVPETLPPTPGLAIQTAFYPAQEVGGDFFQILPLSSGATLVVIGDVAGKGMPAALTVSLVVGTLRTLADYTESPAAILAGLNRRLHNRGTGFTTCLALHFAPDRRTLTLANAGHLPPYRNGDELPTEPSLPLGLDLSATYPETTVTLRETDHLTVLTDGVPEAMHHHELFGFDRTAALVHQPAAEIANAARHHGQTDDITVLTIDILALAPTTPVPRSCRTFSQPEFRSGTPPVRYTRPIPTCLACLASACCCSPSLPSGA